APSITVPSIGYLNAIDSDFERRKNHRMLLCPRASLGVEEPMPRICVCLTPRPQVFQHYAFCWASQGNTIRLLSSSGCPRAPRRSMDRQRNEPPEHCICTSADGSRPCRIDVSPEVSVSHFFYDPRVAGLCTAC